MGASVNQLVVESLESLTDVGDAERGSTSFAIVPNAGRSDRAAGNARVTRFPSARSFFDSSVLIYTDDRASPRRPRRALGLLAKARRAKSGVVSTPVLLECFVRATRELGVPVEVARRKLGQFAHTDRVLLSLPDVRNAIDLHRLQELSF